MRREVRVDNRFFDDVDAAFRPARGPNGEPSADDFIRLDLFGIQEEIAERFDELSVEPTAPDVRVLVLSNCGRMQPGVPHQRAVPIPDVGWLELGHLQFPDVWGDVKSQL